ncbi:allantoin permease [Limnohabitans sp. 2KL-17]|uniref:purine-cytosine permease family protein n=1 Tax=Limnohabitans sp. 2KL-17 TaxID=1100704 RepID=UPI000D3B8C31|nr:cytosine permease [Limnohabitans sp. 2KL-17]PUE60994.1 allantoin permease [Limnohabitans sp. 2KL-17]
MATTVISSLTPIRENERVFSGFTHAALWFSLGVGLLVMQVGAYLVPAVGTRDAIIAILVGSIVGSALLATTAKLGCESGLSSAGLMHRVYGSSFARLPVLLNIVQLIGWTTFELVIMREGTHAIGQQALGLDLGVVWPTLLWGGVLTLLMMGSMLKLVRQFVSRVGLPLVIASLLWLSWHFIGMVNNQGLSVFMDRPGNGSMGMLSAIDLVMAMPVSWLPLVADFARHGRHGRSTFVGTWLGYAIANAWCYALGFLVASMSEPGANLVTVLLLAQGGLLALGLILLDELDNAYGDVYSGAVSANSLKSAWSVRVWGLLLAGLCTALALVLPMHSLEPFLLLLSSVFVPLYGVILGRWSTVVQSADLSIAPKIEPVAAGLWVLGVTVFHACATWAPQYGSALPCLVVTFTLARLLRSASH